MKFFNFISLPRVIVIVISLFIVLVGCLYIFWGKRHNLDSGAIQIVSTTSMITEAVYRVGGEHVNVTGLMGPGIDPHLYRVSAKTVELLQSADIIFYHGLHLEGKMADTLRALSKFKQTIGVADSISHTYLIESEFKGIYDPHVWHDPLLWKMVITQIADQLSDYDPDHSIDYYTNAQNYIQDLDNLDVYIHEMFEKVSDEKRIVVTAHDAFAYFGKRYGVKVVALQGMNTDAQISPKDITNLARFICDHKISTIFVESSIPRRTMEAVFQAVEGYGWHVSIGDELFSDALGPNDSPQGSYCGMMRYNCEAFIRGLQQGAA